MSKREVVDCDRCGGPDVEDPVHLPVFVDRVPDGAGGMENTYKDFDFCPRCSQSLLTSLCSEKSTQDPILSELVRRFILDVSKNWPVR